MNEYKCGNGHCGISIKGCSKHTDKLNTYDWLADLPDNAQACNIVEVQFKPPRKGYFINSNNLSLEKGDIVAVEASPGHDIGTVTMTGRLVPLQIKKAHLKPDTELKRIYRKAKQVDMEKFEEAKAREHQTMIESRQIALELGLKMKIGDVEYQGDGNKAIFYYIADERVDFRHLIKVLADRFHVRIEMKQIGARQEAGRIGGIGPCGRELCCATWMTNFISVSTSAARFQDLSLNPQKLAGQCAKLKCCLNYEVDQYVESLKQMPSRELTLQTIDNEYYFFKADILAHRVTYSTDKHLLANEATISAKRAFEIIMMNREGRKPENIHEDGTQTEQKSLDLLEQENINRFDKTKKKKKRNKENGQRENAPVVAAEEKNVQNERRVKPNVERPKREEGRDRNKPEQKVVKKAEHKAEHKVEQKSEQKVEQKPEVQKKNDHQQQHQRRRKHRSQNSNNNKNNPANGNNNQN